MNDPLRVGATLIDDHGNEYYSAMSDYSIHADTGAGEHFVPIDQEHLDHGHCPCGIAVAWDLGRGQWVPVTFPVREIPSRTED